MLRGHGEEREGDGDDGPPGPLDGLDLAHLGLSAREYRFVWEYLQDLNASAAAVRSGYSPSNARFQGHALLRRPAVQEALRLAQEAMAESLGVRAWRIVRELALLATSDVTLYAVDPRTGRLVVPPGHEDAARAVASYKCKTRAVLGGGKKGGGEAAGGEGEEEGNDRRLVDCEVDIKLWSKLEACRLLGEYLGFLGGKKGEDGVAAGGSGVVVITGVGVDAAAALGLTREAKQQATREEAEDCGRGTGGEGI